MPMIISLFEGQNEVSTGLKHFDVCMYHVHQNECISDKVIFTRLSSVFRRQEKYGRAMCLFIRDSDPHHKDHTWFQYEYNFQISSKENYVLTYFLLSLICLGYLFVTSIVKISVEALVEM